MHRDILFLALFFAIKCRYLSFHFPLSVSFIISSFRWVFDVWIGGLGCLLNCHCCFLALQEGGLT